jgi:hypothetical protein
MKYTSTKRKDMGKFERAALSVAGANLGNLVPEAKDGTPRDRVVDTTSRPDSPHQAGAPSPSPGRRSVRYRTGPRGTPIEVKHEGRERATRAESGRTVVSVKGRRPLILTPQERHVVAVRIRELKREVIPPLLRAMQSPNPDSSDRESYHRATNELDWLLEIVENSAALDRISGPPDGSGAQITTEAKGGSEGSAAGTCPRTSIPGAANADDRSRGRDGTR